MESNSTTCWAAKCDLKNGIPRAGSTPRHLAQVKMPRAPIGDADGFGFLKINDFFQIDGRRQDVDEHIARGQRDDARAQLRTANKTVADGIDRINMTRDTGQAALASIDDIHEVPLRFLVEMPPMNHMNFLAVAQYHPAGI